MQQRLPKTWHENDRILTEQEGTGEPPTQGRDRYHAVMEVSSNDKWHR